MRAMWGMTRLQMRLALPAMLWGVLVAAGARAETPPGPRVALPFSCAVDERGRVRVAPGPEHVYDIVERIESQSVTTCAAGRGGPCRAMTAYRFVVACSGGRAPWIEIAAGASEFRSGGTRVELQDGRLLLSQATRKNN